MNNKDTFPSFSVSGPFLLDVPGVQVPSGSIVPTQRLSSSRALPLHLQFCNCSDVFSCTSSFDVSKPFQPSPSQTVAIASYIYNTKIDEFVCPPNIPETVAVRIMKLAHRPRVASTTIKLISKPILLSILSLLLKHLCESSLTRNTNSRGHLIRPTPFPVMVSQPRVRVKCRRYGLQFAITQSV